MSSMGQLQVKEDALVNFHSELAVTELEVQVRVLTKESALI